MIVIFDRDVLLNALVPTMNTVSGKNTMPTIEGIHITCYEDGRCMLQSYDLEKGTRTYLTAEVEKGGACIINAQKLQQIVKAMPKGGIKFSVDSTFNMVIESGLIHFDIKCLPGSQFPALPELRGDRGFIFPQYLFKKFVNRVVFSIAQGDARPIFNGAYFKVKDNSIKIVACDGNRLAICEHNIEIENTNYDENEPLNLDFIIPGKTLIEALKIVKDVDEEMEIRLTRKYVILKVGKIIFFSKTIDTQYFDYTRLIPTVHNLDFNLDCEQFRSALERSSLIIEDRLSGSIRSYVKFTIDERLSVSTQSPNGNVYDEIDIDKKAGENLVIAFDCKALLDAIKVCDEGPMNLKFENPLKGVLIHPTCKDEGRFTYYVMPMRMTH